MSFYEVLGVARDAAVEEIKKAYLAAARENHPDKQSRCKVQMQSLLVQEKDLHKRSLSRPIHHTLLRMTHFLTFSMHGRQD